MNLYSAQVSTGTGTHQRRSWQGNWSFSIVSPGFPDGKLLGRQRLPSNLLFQTRHLPGKAVGDKLPSMSSTYLLVISFSFSHGIFEQHSSFRTQSSWSIKSRFWNDTLLCDIPYRTCSISGQGSVILYEQHGLILLICMLTLIWPIFELHLGTYIF